MKQLHPYHSLDQALSDLDNGGRLLSFKAKAGDDRIDPSEVAKAAGVIGNRQQLYLYLTMALSELSADAVAEFRGKFSEKLERGYIDHMPVRTTPSAARSVAEAGTSAIVSGIPKHVGSDSELTMFIFIPISTGKTTVMTMVPVIDHYDVYELAGHATHDKVLVTHARGRNKLPEVPMQVGGVFKEYRESEDADDGGLYLDAVYFSIDGGSGAPHPPLADSARL